MQRKYQDLGVMTQKVQHLTSKPDLQYWNMKHSKMMSKISQKTVVERIKKSRSLRSTSRAVTMMRDFFFAVNVTEIDCYILFEGS